MRMSLKRLLEEFGPIHIENRPGANATSPLVQGLIKTPEKQESTPRASPSFQSQLVIAEPKIDKQSETSSALIASVAQTNIEAVHNSLQRSGVYLYGVGLLILPAAFTDNTFVALAFAAPFFVAGWLLRRVSPDAYITQENKLKQG